MQAGIDAITSLAATDPTPAEGWSEAGTHAGGVRCHTRVQPGCPVLMLKAKRRVAGAARCGRGVDALVQFCTGIETLDVLDSTYVSDTAVCLTAPSEDTRTRVHGVYSAVWGLPTPFLWNREMVWKEAVERRADGVGVVCAISVEHPDKPLPEARGERLMRGQIVLAGYVFEPVEGSDDGDVDVSYIVQVDPRGSLPLWLVNMLVTDQAGNVQAIAKQFGKDP